MSEYVPYSNRPEHIEARLRQERNERSAVENIRWRSQNPDAVPVGYQRPAVPPEPVRQPDPPAPVAARPAVPKIVNLAKPAWALALSPDKERALGAALAGGGAEAVETGPPASTRVSRASRGTCPARRWRPSTATRSICPPARSSASPAKP